jgi:glycosyltransferase involved in cell wall biosynthesis
VNTLSLHDALPISRWAWIERILRKTPYIITRRVLNRIKPRTIKIYKKAEKIVALSCAIERAITLSEASLSAVIIPSAFSNLTPDPTQVKLIKKTYEGKKIIGAIGALADHKGLSYLIDAARMIDRDDLAFAFIGEGKDEAKLKERSKGLNNIFFLGFKNNIADYIAAFDLFAFPSLQEGLGSTLIDAMRIGTPIIASNIGGIPELIEHNKTGFLVAPRDAAALKSAIENALANDLSKIVETAKQRSYDFSPENMAKQYVELYRSIVKRDILKEV